MNEKKIIQRRTQNKTKKRDEERYEIQIFVLIKFWYVVEVLSFLFEP
jgi:hypothetical protein